jgi:hypothetical protein
MMIVISDRREHGGASASADLLPDDCYIPDGSVAPGGHVFLFIALAREGLIIRIAIFFWLFYSLSILKIDLIQYIRHRCLSPDTSNPLSF